MGLLQDFAFAKIHVNATGETWIEAPNGAHDVYPFELIRAVVFEDGRILNGVFVRARRAIHVARARVPGRWRIGMIVRDLALANDEMVRKHAAHSFVEDAANGFIR